MNIGSARSEAFVAPKSLDEALTQLGRADPTFNQELRRRLAPVKDRFFTPPPKASDQGVDGLYMAPPYMTEPDLRKVAIEVAELALARGIDVNVAWLEDGSTFLHLCVLLRDSTIAVEAVDWLLAHGADPNRQRADGETPLGLAVKFGRTEVAEVMRAHGTRD
jgi:ankyrin repeat protein